MQLVVRLSPESPVHLPFSYYPKMAAALYQALSSADPAFATELHEGAAHRSRIKLFAFSPLHSRMTEVRPVDKAAKRDGELIFKGETFFKLSSPWPELMNSVGEGLLKTRDFRIGSQLFRVAGAQLIPPPQFQETMTWSPTKTGSVVTSWSPRGTGEKLFAFPDTSVDGHACDALLRTNLIHKWRRLCEIRKDIAVAWAGTTDADAARDAVIADHIGIRFADAAKSGAKPYHTRLHYIKEAPVRSWQAPVTVTGPVAVQRLIWTCGLGEMNSMGFGLMEEARSCC